MNDRYLFKAKGESTEKWYIGLLTRADVDICWIKTKDGEYVCKTSTICQCTGLKDKNGNLIWENDVVRQFADCDEMGNDLYFFYQIKYDEKCARFYGHEIYVKENELFDELDEAEVIGSVIDNLELLEVE